MGKSILKIILKTIFFIVTFSTMISMEQFSLSLIATFLSLDLNTAVHKLGLEKMKIVSLLKSLENTII